MRKLIPIFCLIFFSVAANAEWLLFSKSNTQEVYIDLDSRKISGNKIQFIEYQEFPFGVPYTGGMSVKTLVEIDCYEEMLRILYAVSYKEPKLQGGVVKTNDLTSTSASPIAPNTMQDRLMKLVCK